MDWIGGDWNLSNWTVGKRQIDIGNAYMIRVK